MSEPGKLTKLPEGCRETGSAAEARTTLAPGRPAARSITADCAGKIPTRGDVTAVVKPALRQVSMRLSSALISSAALAHGVVAGRSSGPRERGVCGRGPAGAPPGAAGGGGGGGRAGAGEEKNKPGENVRPTPAKNPGLGGTPGSLTNSAG